MAPRVALFVPCFVARLNNQLSDNIGKIFDHLSVDWHIPQGQTCCGQPSFNAGLWEQTARAAEHWIRLFADSEAVVAPSGSCIAMVRHYPELRQLDPGLRKEARRLAKRSFEFSQFLVDELGLENLAAELNMHVAYHDGCHALRQMQIHDQPRILLNNIKGLHLHELDGDPECCGFGGTFSIKYPEISVDMADAKLAKVRATGCSTLVSTEPSCLMHLEARARRIRQDFVPLHVADLLALGLENAQQQARPKGPHNAIKNDPTALRDPQNSAIAAKTESESTGTSGNSGAQS